MRAVLPGISVATFASPRLSAMLARPAAMAIPPSAAVNAASAAPDAVAAWPVLCTSPRAARRLRPNWTASVVRTTFSAPMMAEAIPRYPYGMVELAMVLSILVGLVGVPLLAIWFVLVL